METYISDLDVKNYFRSAFAHAKVNSTCRKVQVGAVCADHTGIIILACNKSEDDSKNCVKIGECYKYKVTGIYESCEETRKYCSAIHSEINLINKLKKLGFEKALPTMVLFVTRYPCLNCARAICDYGFKTVYYSGIQEISDEVKELFNKNGVEYKWFPEYDFEDHSKKGDN